MLLITYFTDQCLVDNSLWSSYGIISKRGGAKNFSIRPRMLNIQVLKWKITTNTIITSNIGVTLKCGLSGRSRSLDMALFDRIAYEYLFLFHYNYIRVLYRFWISEILVEKRHFFIPLPFNLHDHPELIGVFPKILIQIVRVLIGYYRRSKIMPKSRTCVEWNNGHRLTTDSRQTAVTAHATSRT